MRRPRVVTNKNIHPFHLKVKELRNVLQLGQNSDSKLIAELGAVKDQVGLWHDWSELAAISSKVLDHGVGCPIAAQIRSRPGRRPRRKGVVTEIHPALVTATSRLAS
jgi:CHAD domain-containing protein